MLSPSNIRSYIHNKVSPTWLPKDEIIKDNTIGLANMDEEKAQVVSTLRKELATEENWEQERQASPWRRTQNGSSVWDNQMWK